MSHAAKGQESLGEHSPLVKIFEAEKVFKQKRCDVLKQADEIVAKATDTAKKELDNRVTKARLEIAADYEKALGLQKDKIAKDFSADTEKELAQVRALAKKNFDAAAEMLLSAVVSG